MKKNTREDVASFLVKDKFFEKGHLGLKIFQTVIGSIGWLGVFLPFVWIFTPILFPKLNISQYFHSYSEEIRSLMFLVLFLAVAFVIILITYVALTLWNNHRFGGLLRKENTFDEERLNKRRNLLNNCYTDRFGDKDFRHTVKYYAVKEEQNLDTHFISDLFKENGVGL
ncbi:cell division protein [Enterococcus sp. AZ103]|uniref:cell division protein n=1 Tax=Enterococcus sp. AZ103 TaxID=2774628 RepID=UPI003F2498C4